MQYWLFAFKKGAGNLLIGKYDEYKDAYIERDRLDPLEYECADILAMEWGREPKVISSLSFEVSKNKILRKSR